MHHGTEKEQAIQDQRDAERAEEIRSFVLVATKYLSTPILLSLWLLDLIYIPHLIWECLAIRLISVPLGLALLFLLRKPVSVGKAQKVAALFMMGNSAIVTALIWLSEGISSPYYAGLNLVTFGIVCIPLTIRYAVLNIVLVYYPFFVMAVLKGGTPTQTRVFAIHLFFMGSTVLMCLIMRLYTERLRLEELQARLALKDEVASRDSVIKVKTEEMVNLNQLVKQFSPQVVKAIQHGEISVEGKVKSVPICAIFIDIVSSTDRLQEVPIDDFTEAISHFMKDTTHILLDHDVTIDKYLGDGLLAFSGAPLTQPDYLVRVAQAAIEIRDFFQHRQEKYSRYWKHPFAVRFGIASGPANVGFYGSEKSFRSYTAIGEPVNLAARLCSNAEANSILVDKNLFEAVKGVYDLEKTPPLKFKGFEGRNIETYHLLRQIRRRTAA